MIIEKTPEPVKEVEEKIEEKVEEKVEEPISGAVEKGSDKESVKLTEEPAVVEPLVTDESAAFSAEKASQTEEFLPSPTKRKRSSSSPRMPYDLTKHLKKPNGKKDKDDKGKGRK